MAFFFDDLIDVDLLSNELPRDTSQRAYEVRRLAFSIIYKRIIAVVFERLPKIYYEDFARLLAENPADPTLLDFLIQRIGPGIREDIREEFSKVCEDLKKSLSREAPESVEALEDGNDLNTIIDLIVAAGEDISTWLQHEKELQWQHARHWTALCGTIPAFAFIVVYKTLHSGSQEMSDTQIAFYKDIENNLFDYYQQQSAGRHVSIGQCLPLTSERRAVCDCWAAPENTLVTMDMLLGIIFPNRCRLYQTDWIEGFPSKGFGTPAEYAAMRLAADLIGIPTPSSLHGLTAEELGIMPYGSALKPLQNFVFSYLQREGGL